MAVAKAAESATALDQLCINTIRTLSMDAVQQANSGHPGTPMAMAPVVYTLWQRFLRFDPEDPIWPNRDRFVLSIGHASMLLYSMLHLTGVKAVNPQYERLGAPRVPLDDIRRVPPARQQVPGPSRIPLDLRRRDHHRAARPGRGHQRRHGDRRALDGAPTSTGPASSMFDHDVYALCGDGDMMEGVSSEAASLAGHLKLWRTCAGSTTTTGSPSRATPSWAFTEDVATRFIGYGWNVTRVGDANDLEMLGARLRHVPDGAPSGRP